MSADVVKLREDESSRVERSDMEEMLGHALGRAEAGLLDGILIVQVLKNGSVVTNWTFDAAKMPATLIYALERLKHDLLAAQS